MVTNKFWVDVFFSLSNLMISNDLIFPKFWSRCFDEKLEKHETYDALIKDLKENRILEGLDMFTQEYEKDLQIDLYKWLCSVSQRLSTKYPEVRFCILRHLFEFIEFMHIEKTLCFIWQNFSLSSKTAMEDVYKL